MKQTPNTAPTGHVWGGPVADDRLAPFQGRWTFKSHRYEDETLKVRISGGPDLVIVGHVIEFGPEAVHGELRLCNLHEHGGRLCGEGSHHEDIHDPGDMSRRHFTIELIDGDLVLRQRVVPDADFSDDPVFAPANAICHADDQIGDATPWFVLRYARAQSKDR